MGQAMCFASLSTSHITALIKMPGSKWVKYVARAFKISWPIGRWEIAFRRWLSAASHETVQLMIPNTEEACFDF